MNDHVTIRCERTEDFGSIRAVVREAFAMAPHSDGDEHNLIERLRQTDDYIRGLSLVAETDGKIVGHIMFSRIYIADREALALAPLAVHPNVQRRGIGRLMIQSGHRLAREMGYCCSVVLGAPEYYTKSGFLPAYSFGITPPFDVPSQFYMVYPLSSSLPSGRVRYSAAFAL